MSRKVVVTGGAGFIGTHVVKRLMDRDWHVVVVDNLSSGRLENVPDGAEFYQMDVSASSFVDLIGDLMPDGVIHLAAQVSVQASVRDPMFDASVNVMGTLNTLEACRRANVHNVVFASSAAVYGVPSVLPLHEGLRLAPISPYGIAKKTSEEYLRCYTDLYGMKVICARYANVYGPLQSPDGDGGVIAKFVQCLVQDQAPIIYGDGGQVRDFTFVHDVADANIMALEFLLQSQEPFFQTVNISTGVGHTLLDVYGLLAEFIPDAKKPIMAAERSGDIRESVLSNAAAQTLLGWSPVVSLRNGLLATTEWARRFAGSVR